MQNFRYSNPVNIIFGKETERHVGKLLIRAGVRKVLLHYGGGSIKRSGLYDRIISRIEEEGVAWVELGGVVSNPRLSKVYTGIELCRKEGVDFILAVGGGSVIDSSKAIAAGVTYAGDVWELLEGKGGIETSIGVGTILTIPAAGSEVSSGFVITKEEGHLKRAYSHASLRPVFSILNPELTYTLPAYQTACGVVDMLAHTMERYFTREPHVEVTDRMAEGLMNAIIDIGSKLMDEPDNYDYRAEIMWAGTNAHSGLLGTGRIEDWASHDIEHELSGLYDIAHGAGLSIIFPAWMKYVYKTDIQKFVDWARRVFDIAVEIDNPEQTVLKGITALEGFFRSINMPVRLSDAGINDEKVDEMAHKATAGGTKTLGNFVKLNEKDVAAIYRLAK